MKKIKRGLAILLTCLLLISTSSTGLAAKVQAQTIATQGTVSRTALEQVINDLVQWERAYIQAAFQAASAQEIVDPTVYNWPTIGLGRLERYAGLSLYLAENEKYLQQNWTSTLRKVTNLARISLAVGAAQGNPRDYAGKDLIAEIYNYANIEAQGINGPIFALIALDSGGFELPATAKWTRAELLKIILNKQLAEGGFSLDGSGKGDVDITAMAIQALAPYYRAGQPEVKAVVAKAVDYLAKVQEADGGFKSWGTKNSESVCQAIIALCSIGIDIDTDPRFIKNSNTLLSDLLKFRAADGGFQHVLAGSSNNMASEQALIALAAYARFQAKQSSLYDYHPEKLIPYPSIPGEQPDPSSPGIIRIAGVDRYATAVEIAQQNFPQGAEKVILARGDVSADALPAVPLAKKYQAPLLLTPSEELPSAVFKAIQGLGAKKVLIMGGEGAVSKQVSATLAQAGIEVQRVFGKDHYATAYEIAKLLGNQGQAVIVSGDYANSYSDALSISAWAAYNGVPILYADKSAQLPKATQQAIAELGVKKTFLIGGTAVLSLELEQILPDPKRYGGQTRYDTNTTVLSQLQPNPTKIFVATGGGFADALAGAAVAGQSNAWILLTEQVSSGGSGLTGGQEQLLQAVRNLSPETYVLGGTAVVSTSTLLALKQILQK
jgi:putative cell wall-binding protein